MNNILAVLAIVLTVFTSGCIGTGVNTGIPGPTGGTGEWCNEGANWRTANPQTGEMSTFNIEGIVQHEGRTTCKAVWTASNTENDATMEYYFTEDENYTHFLMYNEEGQLQYEMEITDSSSSFKLYDENGSVITEGNYGN